MEIRVKKQKFVPALLLLALAGCEQENQALPFDVEAVVSKTIPTSGGNVSTPAGAAVIFPASSLPSSTSVSVATTDAPSATRQIGAPASTSFKVEPAGTVLNTPATAELKFTPSTDAGRAWLATVVTEVNGTATPNANTRVDLSTQVVSSKVRKLGTYTTVIPPAGSIFSVQGVSASIAPAPTDLLPNFAVVSAQCGAGATPCTGLNVEVTQNVLDQVDDAAVIYPSMSGSLAASSLPITGQIQAEATLRVKLKNGTTAESIGLVATLEPTSASRLISTSDGYIITAVRHTITGSAGELGSGSADEVRDLVISGSSIVIDRTFQIRVRGGALEDARVTVYFPVTVE